MTRVKLVSISCFFSFFYKRSFSQFENIPPQNKDTEVVYVQKICLMSSVLKSIL